MRMPLTVWAWFVTAILGLLAFGVLLAGGNPAAARPIAGTSFFVPAGLSRHRHAAESTKAARLCSGSTYSGSSAIPRFTSHPARHGHWSHLLRRFRASRFGYRAMAYASARIGFLGFLVWGHHMFVSGMSPYSGFAFSVLTLAIGVPSAIKTSTGSERSGVARSSSLSPMLFALGFVSLFVTGGLSGLFLRAGGGQPSCTPPITWSPTFTS